MSALLIRGGRVVDPAAGRDERADVLIEDGRVRAVGAGIAAPGARVLDAAGRIVAPGFIDLRARLREPGLEHAETIETGSRAAAAGGFATVCCPPTTQPFNDSATVTSFIVDRAKSRAAVRVLPIGGLTKDGAGEQLAEIGSMRLAGAAAVGDGDRTVMDAALMRRAMRYAASFGLTVVAHCEDARLGGGDIHEGVLAARLGLSGIPTTAETVVLARDLILCAETGARLHVAHLSSAAAVEMVRRAKGEGAPVTADVAAAHLALCVEDVVPFDSNYKVRPPLREAADRDALVAGVADGTVDAIASDHAPHTGNVKMQEFETCPFGMSALETAVAIAFDRLVRSGAAPLSRFVEALSAGPARILGRRRSGSLAAGCRGDVTIFDPERRWSFTADSTYSKSKNSPFLDRSFLGGPAATVVAGQVVWTAEDGLLL